MLSEFKNGIKGGEKLPEVRTFQQQQGDYAFSTMFLIKRRANVFVDLSSN